MNFGVLFHFRIGTCDQLISSYLSPAAPYLGIQTFADNMASNPDELRGFLMKELECPVCLEVPRTTPIYQCTQEHIHCNVCHPKLNHCPICRSAIKMDSRNLLAEKIHKKIIQVDSSTLRLGSMLGSLEPFFSSFWEAQSLIFFFVPRLELGSARVLKESSRVLEDLDLRTWDENESRVLL